MSIADNIRALRESHGMTQAEFGKIAGVSDKAVSTWENGSKSPRIETAKKIAQYFGIAWTDLLDGDIQVSSFQSLFDRLDQDDKTWIIGKMTMMLESDKYKKDTSGKVG